MSQETEIHDPGSSRPGGRSTARPSRRHRAAATHGAALRTWGAVGEPRPVSGSDGSAGRSLFLYRPPRPRLERDERLLRAFQVTVAAVALVAALPLMLLCALAIKLTSPGPLVFTQVRVGLDRRGSGGGGGRRDGDLGGRPFRIYKFRTMVHDPGESSRDVTTKPGDPRVTPVGRVLREFHLDELPQLVNVLKGDMSLIGPRPEQPEIFARLRAEVPGYAARQRVPPGISGLAQVRYGYGAEPEDARAKLRYDLLYARRRSVALDGRVLLETLPAVLTRRGAR